MSKRESKKVIDTEKQVQRLVQYLSKRRKRMAGRLDKYTGLTSV